MAAFGTSVCIVAVIDRFVVKAVPLPQVVYSFAAVGGHWRGGQEGQAVVVHEIVSSLAASPHFLLPAAALHLQTHVSHPATRTGSVWSMAGAVQALIVVVR